MENEISPNELDVKLSEKARRRAVKGDTNFTVGGLLIYFVIFLGVEVADMIIRMIGMIIKSGGDPDVQVIIDETVDYYLTHAGGLIVGVILGVAFMFLFFRNRVKPAELFRSRGKMTPRPSSCFCAFSWAASWCSQGWASLWRCSSTTSALPLKWELRLHRPARARFPCSSMPVSWVPLPRSWCSEASL